jgi:tRNA(adenine34) deaminase
MPQSPESASPQDIAFMQMALQQAADAAAAGEIPVGAVVVKDGMVVGAGRNSPIQSMDPTAHAEIVALRAAANALGNYRLEDCTLYVTLEPCAMCSGAILHGRLKRVVFGAVDPKTGCAGSVLNLFTQPQLNHHTQLDSGLLAEESSAVLQEFFRNKRARQREVAQPLREDALRTPERCFEALTDLWPGHFQDDLPGIGGLRLHFVDQGPADSSTVYLCLHPVPGWSYIYQPTMATWLGQGARVVAPDLIGFGRSDKPKREDFHSPDLHRHYLLAWLQRLDLQNVVLVVPRADHWLALHLVAQVPERIRQVLVQQPGASSGQALDAPYPDAGHRAAERAFAKMGLSETGTKQ